MTGAGDVIGQRAVNDHVGAALNKCLDLRLPLFGSHEAGSGEHRENGFRTRSLAQELIKRTSRRHTFTAFAGENKRATFLKDAPTSS